MNASTAPLPDERLIEVTRRFSYPPTPDVAEAVMKRLESGGRPRARMRSAWAVTGLLVLLLAVLLFAVPGVRAEIVRFFQVGVVRIFPADATQTAIPASPQVPSTATPATSLEGTRKPQLRLYRPNLSHFIPSLLLAWPVKRASKSHGTACHSRSAYLNIPRIWVHPTGYSCKRMIKWSSWRGPSQTTLTRPA